MVRHRSDSSLNDQDLKCAQAWGQTAEELESGADYLDRRQALRSEVLSQEIVDYNPYGPPDKQPDQGRAYA
jgi:hypothetical protein